MTFPMSRADVAPVSAIASATAASMSASEAAAGRYSSITASSASSFTAEPSRPAARKASADSRRCFASVCNALMASASVKPSRFSICLFASAVFIIRSADSRAASRAFMASRISFSTRSKISDMDRPSAYPMNSASTLFGINPASNARSSRS